MQLIRKLALTTATLAVAFGAGHLVQSGIERRSDEKVASAAAPPKRIVPLAASPDLDAMFAKLPSAGEPPAMAAPEAATASTTPPPVAEAAPSEAAATACPLTLDVTPRARAMLDVMLIAPCAKETPVVLRHGGLAISARTSPTGALFVALPAMQGDGAVSALFPDGALAQAAAPVPMAGIHRFAVQWIANDALQLQVYENGAVFGAPGHVSAANPQGAGSLVSLGDATLDLPMMSEVYTFPEGKLPVRVTVEAAVTEATCGRELLAEALESRDGNLTSTDVALTMPGCEAVGDFLVLNNLLTGTTLATKE